MAPVIEAAEDAARRRREADELLARHRRSLLRMARRHSLCDADAEDALHSALVICLLKSPSCEGDGLVRWMHVVTRNEARALRRSRQRLLGVGPDGDAVADRPDADAPDPHERAERGEELAGRALALSLLRPDQRRALGLQAAGLSYAEIAAHCGWTYTKVNRSIAEGRARLRSMRAQPAPSPSSS
jgi:RNA polymerase sigma factor (sigma-70 family)